MKRRSGSDSITTSYLMPAGFQAGHLDQQLQLDEEIKLHNDGTLPHFGFNCSNQTVFPCSSNTAIVAENFPKSSLEEELAQVKTEIGSYNGATFFNSNVNPTLRTPSSSKYNGADFVSPQRWRISESLISPMRNAVLCSSPNVTTFDLIVKTNDASQVEDGGAFTGHLSSLNTPKLRRSCATLPSSKLSANKGAIEFKFSGTDVESLSGGKPRLIKVEEISSSLQKPNAINDLSERYEAKPKLSKKAVRSFSSLFADVCSNSSAAGNPVEFSASSINMLADDARLLTPEYWPPNLPSSSESVNAGHAEICSSSRFEFSCLTSTPVVLKEKPFSCHSRHVEVIGGNVNSGTGTDEMPSFDRFALSSKCFQSDAANPCSGSACSENLMLASCHFNNRLLMTPKRETTASGSFVIFPKTPTPFKKRLAALEQSQGRIDNSMDNPFVLAQDITEIIQKETSQSSAASQFLASNGDNTFDFDRTPEGEVSMDFKSNRLAGRAKISKLVHDDTVLFACSPLTLLNSECNQLDKRKTFQEDPESRASDSTGAFVPKPLLSAADWRTIVCGRTRAQIEMTEKAKQILGIGIHGDRTDF